MPRMDVNFTLVCKGYDHRKGIGKESGKEYNFYDCEFRDPLSDQTYFWVVQAQDEKNPPVVDMEYPVSLNIYRDFNKKLAYRLFIDSQYIS